MIDLTGKVILVTGGSKGIGAAISLVNGIYFFLPQRAQRAQRKRKEREK